VAALYDPAQHGPLTYLYGQNPRVAGLSFLSWTLCSLGYLDQALDRIQEALSEARELGHFNSIAFALFFGCLVHHFRRDRQTTQEWTKEVISLCTEQRLSFWLALGLCMDGWAIANTQPEIGVAEIRSGLEQFRGAGAEYFVPLLLALLAMVLAECGQDSVALELVGDALAQVSRTEERWFEPELHRLRGEWLMSRDPGEAERSFIEALQLARRSSARLWELRASRSLARLWQQQNRRSEARTLVGPIYGWFNEGLDTPDLSEARTLLQELGVAPPGCYPSGSADFCKTD